MAAEAERTERVTIRDVRAMRRRGQPIAMVTAYDVLTARAADDAGIPMILVGDSLGTTVLGLESEVRVTLDDMLHHTKAVMRGARRPLVVADMPFMSYQAGVEQAVRNAGRLLQEGGANAVKLEGGQPVLQTVQRIVDAGVPVMGHLGVTPQSAYQIGRYRVRGRTGTVANQLLEDALALEAAGAFAIVLELVAGWLATEITTALRIPTIGIGSGPGCSGQVQVMADVVGLTVGRAPRHAGHYGALGEEMRRALRAYAADVQARTFPGPDHYTEGARPRTFQPRQRDDDADLPDEG